MFARLALIAPVDAGAVAGGQTLMLVGLLILALRQADEGDGRRIGRALVATGFRPEHGFERFAAAFPAGSTQGLRAATIVTLLQGGVPGGFPGVHGPL